MKVCNNITVEEHLNNLNKTKDAQLKPVMDAMKDVGKDWWQPPPPEPIKKKEFKKEKKSPATSRKRTIKTVSKTSPPKKSLKRR